MAHLRDRFAAPILLKMAKLWPVVGLLGPRQVGKTTLIQNLFDAKEPVSFDDLEAREEASRSPNTFLARLQSPIILDEVQKAPAVFDAIKLQVDKKRIPGKYFLTGSSTFSGKINIRESLTGRIGLVELLPMTIAEIHRKPFIPIADLSTPLSSKAIRFDSEMIAKHVISGGMPVPAFIRDSEQREFYWRSWLETTLLRDLSRFFKRSYDPDLAFSLLNKLGSVLREGELPTLKHFSQPVRQVRSYFEAMQDIFLLRKINCHPAGIGKEIWIPMDSGLCAYLMGKQIGEGGMLSLVRNFLWNEWISQNEYQGRRMEKYYYKSAQGSPVDLVLNDVPFKIVADPISVTRRLKWEERPLLGAMKKLKSKKGYLVAPISTPRFPSTKENIGILPWGWWS